MTQMTGGQAVVESLRHEGVEVVFGLPGVQIMHIYDAFYEQSDIRVMTVRHEQTTAYMADGYARVTGQPGVALVVARSRRAECQRGTRDGLFVLLAGLTARRTSGKCQHRQ